ncbi:UDP-N-acetylmuramate dehydrogenase [Anaerobacillus isosaccharinicus]|uniref:UDP-N-acetylenolpyruvoylglucosamine reductase n=1 Tax=Anaerobacillus isosaccharinicus TaxID=1532552 RepID=A0A1S2M7H1_9BACI|nr:UDP-N-acetylmuramate dehydrogenase [Anaerobacillus isosaccharinicus]MBA5587436.1 UDP-N-acetylmuramate dehydrogenase [Anaerobacillus isosaccharinicus]QOY34377.1 UDP-N-acetylmuramate dehydrogenase [Anaerobacillus isosaccharinicus]
MDRLVKRLQEANVGQLKENEPLANHTTWKIGGPARLLVIPKDIECLITTLVITNESNVPAFIIGRGSNLLISDEGIEGVVVKITDCLDHLEVNGKEVLVGAGYSLIKLATILSKQGLSGLEFAGGIPGSVGGAVFMNAGAHKSDISKILKKARVLYPDGTEKWYNNEEMEFSYRTSRLQKDQGICLEAVFGLEKGNREEIVAEIQKNKQYRKTTQPWDYPCCGSVFRNPPGHHAGKLIEDAGLKGYTIGGAQVSTMHANFIVNVGGAKASDVLNLIDYIKAEVYRKYNVEMETEVEMVGNKQ